MPISPFASWKTLDSFGLIPATNPFTRSKSAHGENMGIWETLKNWLFGCKIATTEDIRYAVEIALENVDTDKDGYISVAEFVDWVRLVLKYGRK